MHAAKHINVEAPASNVARVARKLIMKSQMKAGVRARKASQARALTDRLERAF
ncbi:hypothetical protein OE88DRAFT_1668198 [Heliocybe sulcata]|uniref:Uncharacterized protein n=1 Tax=Heliocybe sulcata TaxID=5364 RepID=A0A5C3MKW7_9AGAM|nr:hypothetical protein OE88DRAFT_1668198 [Heliocybe sulcata]